jgi:O-antigen biosynthesis protein
VSAERLRQARLRLLDSDRALEAMRRSDSWWLTQPLRALQWRWPGLSRRGMTLLKSVAWALSGQLPARLRGRRAVLAAAPSPVAALPGAPPALPDAPASRHILIVDTAVPQPDRDAGSRATLGVIETLRDAGWAVTFWPHDRRDAGRHTAALAALGVAVIDAREPRGFASWLAAHAEAFGHILLMRPRPAAALLADALRHGRGTLSYYGHDIHGLRLLREAELCRDRFLADAAARELATERQIWRVVDTVLYLSDSETTYVREAEPSVAAHTVPAFAFASFPEPPAPPATQALLFVGGFAHAPNQDAALWFAREVFPLVRAARPAATLVLAGANPPPAVQALAGSGVEVAGWLSDADLAARYAATRVVVGPLRFGAGVKGKVVDALHQGFPLVATSVAVEGLPGLAGVVPVADTPAALADAILRLLADDAVWTAQAAAQIRYARQHCSREALRTALLAALRAGA